MKTGTVCVPCGEDRVYSLATVVVAGDPMCNAHARAAGNDLAVELAKPHVPLPPSPDVPFEEKIRVIQGFPATMSFGEMARRVGVSQPTAKKYWEEAHSAPEKIGAAEVAVPEPVDLRETAVVVTEREVPIEEAKAMFTWPMVELQPLVIRSLEESFGTAGVPQPAKMSDSYDAVIGDLRTTLERLVAAADETRGVLESLEQRRATL